jgi:hypothetical protein
MYFTADVQHFDLVPEYQLPNVVPLIERWEMKEK